MAFTPQIIMGPILCAARAVRGVGPFFFALSSNMPFFFASRESCVPFMQCAGMGLFLARPSSNLKLEPWPILRAAQAVCGMGHFFFSARVYKGSICPINCHSACMARVPRFVTLGRPCAAQAAARDDTLRTGRPARVASSDVTGQAPVRFDLTDFLLRVPVAILWPADPFRPYNPLEVSSL